MQEALGSIKHTHLQVGRVYNREYIGPNEDYKQCGGKSTYRVVSTGKELVVEELFSSIGSTFNQYISSTTTFPVPHYFTSDEHVVYECPDESKWFVHKVIMPLRDAVEKGVIEIETLKAVFRDQSSNFITTSPVLCHSNGKRELQMEATPIAEFPHLRSVAFVFKSTADLKKQVTEVFPKAWFML